MKVFAKSRQSKQRRNLGKSEEAISTGFDARGQGKATYILRYRFSRATNP
uniref:Uncharacterized protein n=1 Tax=Siphoviridae sp. ctWuM9 TaxID=2826364 RepID=A0A8S5MF38_9CAUD|nr:MAG TPA: hypothetical protein [Siphoviridae sp. ctWuM9]